MLTNGFFFSLNQIQDIDDTVSDTSQTGSSNSLSALDVNEKQLKCQSITEISDMVLFFFLYLVKCSIHRLSFLVFYRCIYKLRTPYGYLLVLMFLPGS